MKEAKSKKWTYRAPIVKTVFYLLMSLCLCTASYLALLDPLMYSENPIFKKSQWATLVFLFHYLCYISL